jgi:streptogramin lyase
MRSHAVLAGMGVVLALSIQAGSASATTVTALPDAGSTQLAPGADGLMWGVEVQETRASRSYAVVRLDANGLVTRTPLRDAVPSTDSFGELNVLPDGSMALFARGPAGTALIRLARGSGAISTVRKLPQVPEATTGLTLAPDGAVWFARSCRDEVDRVAADGGVTRVPLGRLGCGSHQHDRERGASLAFDPTGALWLVNLCQGRIVRISPAHRVRSWRPPRISCSSTSGFGPVQPAKIEPDPRGGIAYTDADLYHAGRVRNGRLERFGSAGTGTFLADGVLWRPIVRGLERRNLDGSTTTTKLLSPTAQSVISDSVLGRGDTLVRVDATYWKTYPGDSHHVEQSVFVGPQVDVFDRSGLQASYALPGSEPDAPRQIGSAAVTLAPDGSLWVWEIMHAMRDDGFAERVRIVPDRVAAPRPPVTQARSAVTRAGRMLWITLSCDAERARFCNGTAALAHGGTVRPARFAIAGQRSGAVPLRLSRRIVRDLTRRRVVDATVIVDVQGVAVTRRVVRIPRRR